MDVRGRILIVEDELIIAEDLAGKLKRLGHEVVGTAIAGDEAISIAEQVHPDIVLMDIQLEGQMSGVEAARIIQDRTDAQIIFVTAFPGVFINAPDQMRAPGICLGKPFSRIQLEAALAAAFASPRHGPQPPLQ